LGTLGTGILPISKMTLSAPSIFLSKEFHAAGPARGEIKPATSAGSGRKTSQKNSSKQSPTRGNRGRADRVQKTAEVGALLAERLARGYPKAGCSLNFSSPFELLVATILSAQCTDKRVNLTTPSIFSRYKTAADYAEAPLEDLEALFRSCGTFRNKAKAVKASCQEIVEKRGGEVPGDMERLHALPGLGRKSANVILGCAFDVPSIIVDTHIVRLSGRLGLATPHFVEKKYAEKIERELLDIVPKKDRTLFSHLLGTHGRECCSARKPKCPDCPIHKLCPYPDKTM